jgi:hypothetical protein
MPELTLRRTSVELLGNAFEDVFDSVVKGMEHRRQSRELDVIGLAVNALPKERSVGLQ